MTEVTVPTAPPLVTVPNVELMHTGQWPISTGIANFTSGDLANAVAALDCPAVRRPVLKLGHSEPDPDAQGMRWDGEPAVGYIANMGVVEGGQTLVGDYAGMPAWLGRDVLASAYPDRSIEGQYDFRCQIGHVHPFVVTAVALLGVVPPGIGTLQSLQDVATLYGVTESNEVAAAPADRGATPFTVTVHAAREDAVPNPRPTEVRAGVTTDDIRRAFYTSDYGKSWDIWICEMQLGPDLQLITTDDASGTMSRVPVTIGDGDGEDAVTFGEPVKVVVRYEDAAVAAAAASNGTAAQVLRFASRAESRPGERPVVEAAAEEPADAPAPVDGPAPAQAATTNPPPAPAAGTTNEEGAAMDAALLREALGLSPEASDDEVRTALTDNGLADTQAASAEDPAPDGEGDAGEREEEGSDTDPATAATSEDPGVQAGASHRQERPLPPGTVVVDESTLEQLRQDARQGVEARAQQRREARDRTLDDAIKAGKFPPARRDHWAAYWDTDEEGARQALASLADGLVPVADLGEPGGEPDASAAANAEYDRLFPPAPTANARS